MIQKKYITRQEVEYIYYMIQKNTSQEIEYMNSPLKYIYKSFDAYKNTIYSILSIEYYLNKKFNINMNYKNIDFTNINGIKLIGKRVLRELIYKKIKEHNHTLFFCLNPMEYAPSGTMNCSRMGNN